MLRPCILDVCQPVESLERESSQLPEHERGIERAPVVGLSNDIEQNQISVRMLGRSERARNEPAPALGPWMIWTARLARRTRAPCRTRDRPIAPGRSEEHTSELQSLMRISYAVFFLKNKQNTQIERDCR